MEDFQCTKCPAMWKDAPGPHVCCPGCGSAYVKWITYVESKYFDKKGKPR